MPKVFPSVVHLLADTAARWPEREALVAGGRRLSYRGYLSCVAGFARELTGFQVRGERVVRPVGLGDLHHFHLVELVLADHAARVLAVGPGLRTEARRMTYES